MIRPLLSFTLCLGAVAAATAPTMAEVDAQIAQAVLWLSKQQTAAGAFANDERFALGTTQLVALGMLEAGIPATDPTLTKAIDYIKTQVQADGSIANPETGNANYTTSLGVMVLTRAGADPAIIGNAINYLRGIQNKEPGSINVGGAGYGSRGAGNEDLSNSSFWIEAMRAGGVPASDPAMQKALEFAQRCQDLSSHNKLAWAKNNSGGAAYSPDSSKAAGSYQDGTTGEKPKDPKQPGQAVELAPYASMTYALIKSYLYLDLKAGDPRVDAAVNWIRNNYSFDKNPGMREGQELEGLFYSYQVAAKALRMLGQPTLDVPGQGVRDWRADLMAAIAARAQKGEQGGAWWINAKERWGEGVPQLCTGYSLLALSHIKASLAGN